MALTPKQNAFIGEYLKDLNGTQAAIRAGYSAHTAESQAARLLGNVKVRTVLDEALKRRAARTEVKADDILRELARVALTDIGQAFDDEGRLRPLKDIPEDVRRAIAGIEVEELYEWENKERVNIGRVRKVKFWDKTRGLELLGKHFKLYTEKIEHSGSLTLEQLVLESMKKPEGK